MKLKKDLILKEIAGEHIAVPVGAMTADLSGMIKLNEQGAFLWKLLQNETNEAELTAELLSEYEVDETTAKTDVANFVRKLKEAGFLE